MTERLASGIAAPFSESPSPGIKKLQRPWVWAGCQCADDDPSLSISAQEHSIRRTKGVIRRCLIEW